MSLSTKHLDGLRHGKENGITPGGTCPARIVPLSMTIGDGDGNLILATSVSKSAHDRQFQRVREATTTRRVFHSDRKSFFSHLAPYALVQSVSGLIRPFVV